MANKNVGRIANRRYTFFANNSVGMDKEMAMASFTTRVEMHGATDEDYERLHSELGKYGFKRTIVGVANDGVQRTYVLPTAEYDYTSSSTAHQVRDLALRVANGIRPNSWALVTQVSERSWSTRVV